jgi:hypothetical protein
MDELRETTKYYYVMITDSTVSIQTAYPHHKSQTYYRLFNPIRANDIKIRHLNYWQFGDSC